jgi:hypothetical protein
MPCLVNILPPMPHVNTVCMPCFKHSLQVIDDGLMMVMKAAADEHFLLCKT